MERERGAQSILRLPEGFPWQEKGAAAAVRVLPEEIQEAPSWHSRTEDWAQYWLAAAAGILLWAFLLLAVMLAISGPLGTIVERIAAP